MMDPRWEHIMQMVMWIAAAGIAALACQISYKLGATLAHEVSLCGGLC